MLCVPCLAERLDLTSEGKFQLEYYFGLINDDLLNLPSKIRKLGRVMAVRPKTLYKAEVLFCSAATARPALASSIFLAHEKSKHTFQYTEGREVIVRHCALCPRGVCFTLCLDTQIGFLSHSLKHVSPFTAPSWCLINLSHLSHCSSVLITYTVSSGTLHVCTQPKGQINTRFPDAKQSHGYAQYIDTHTHTCNSVLGKENKYIYI